VQRRPDGLSVQLEVVETPAELLRRARTEAPSALVLSMAALETVAPLAPPGAPLFACAPEDDGAARARAAALGAHAVFGLPLDLRAALPVIRARLCIEGESLRALLAHPSPERASALARSLRARDVEVVTTSDAANLLSAVAAVAPDLVLLGDPVAETTSTAVMAEDDLFGGGAAPKAAWPGAEALSALLAGHPRFADVPRVRVDAASEGRDARLPEDAEARRAEVRRRLVEARRASVTRTVDVATGCLGPVAVLSAADREIAAARRSRVPLAVVRLDLDEVAALRVRHGPSGVRAALARVAGALRAGLRETDLVGRVGPYALLALLPGCTAEHARARLEDISGPMERDVGRVRIGVADTFSGFEDVLLRADRDRVSGPERG
jgi:GGDEF domain-containing protein